MTTLRLRFFGPATISLSVFFWIACAKAQTPPASAAPQASAQNNVLPVVIFTTWRDPREGAFTLSVPQGWQVRRRDATLRSGYHSRRSGFNA
jgi:uncharacterized lipoprotein YajG